VDPLSEADPRSVRGYRLQARLGAGGMGQVYLASSPGGRAVAVKVIHPELARDRAFVARFRREVAAARQVSGAYTAPVVDASGEGEDQLWLATAFVPGPSLARAVADAGPLAPESVWRLAAGLAEALAVIHAHGLVHRDLKPPNVLLAADGPRLIDFGISRALDATTATTTGAIVGTPAFMSPEQAEGSPAGPASDVFSLGCVLAYAATGTGLFGSGTPASIIYRIVHTQPSLDGITGPLRDLITWCLAKDPAHRASITELMSLITAQPSPATSALAFWPAGLENVIASYQDQLTGQPLPAALPGPGSRPALPPDQPAAPQQPLTLAQEPITAHLSGQASHQPSPLPGHPQGPPAHRRILTVAVTAAAALVLAVGCTGVGWALGRAHPRTITHTVTRSVTVTHWRTHTVTAPGGVPCLELNGRIWFAGGAAGTPGGGGPQTTTCTVTPVPPYASGIIAVTAADGTSGGRYQPVPGG